MKILPKPSDFYNVEMDRYGDMTDHPRVVIRIQDESENIPELCEKINEFIEQGYRFTKVHLGGDMIGWKYFQMELKK